MKILLINPNSDPEMTATIRSAAEHFAAGEFDVVTELTPDAPKFIETYEDQVKAATGMIQLVRDYESEYDAFIVACHCDPNLDTIKEITRKPVVGIGEASMKLATMLGHRFSVVSATSHSTPNKEALIRQYHLQDQLASVRSPADENLTCSLEEKFLEAAQLALDEDKAEVIVLGCACLAGLDKSLQGRLGVPICALIIAVGLVKYGVSTSKIRRYNPDY